MTATDLSQFIINFRQPLLSIKIYFNTWFYYTQDRNKVGRYRNRNQAVFKLSSKGSQMIMHRPGVINGFLSQCKHRFCPAIIWQNYTKLYCITVTTTSTQTSYQAKKSHCFPHCFHDTIRKLTFVSPFTMCLMTCMSRGYMATCVYMCETWAITENCFIFYQYLTITSLVIGI